MSREIPEQEKSFTRRSKEQAERIVELRQKIADSPGAQRMGEKNMLLRSFKGVQRATVSFIGLLEAANENERLHAAMMSNMRYPEDLQIREAFTNELDDVASALSMRYAQLIDHARRVMKGEKEREGNLVSKYEEKVKELVAVPEVDFIRQFRNYLTHYQNPPWNWLTNMDFVKNSSALTVQLNCVSLLEWDKWSPTSRAFISSFAPFMPLLPIVKTFGFKIELFWIWFIDEWQAQYNDERKKTNLIIEELNLAITGGAYSDQESFAKAVLSNFKSQND